MVICKKNLVFKFSGVYDSPFRGYQRNFFRCYEHFFGKKFAVIKEKNFGG